MKKSLIIGVLAASISTSSLTPLNVLADSNESERQTIYTQSIPNTNELTDSISKLGAQIPIAQTYSLMILKQSNFNMDTLGSSGIKNEQAVIKKLALEYLDKHVPNLFGVNQSMQRFTRKFNAYYNKLYALAGKIEESDNAKKTLIKHLSKLHDQEQSNCKNIKEISVLLNQFNNTLVTHNESLSRFDEIAIQGLKGSDTTISQLRNDLKRIQEEIDAELTKILNSPSEIAKTAINIGKLTYELIKNHNFNIATFSIGNEFLHSSDSQVKKSSIIIQEKQKELKIIIEKLTESEIQEVEIAFIENQVKNFKNQSDQQIKFLQDIFNVNKQLNTMMDQIILDLNTNSTSSKNLQEKLTTIKQFSDEINKQTIAFDKIIKNVELKSL
ncbi:HBL/NHE enterotoxin family protein [Bacillus fungorum]|uniref:HBL/NHE enterotoxin family protein n=1 Tax=Bacillus fungorum TaxID=2039284 RepID=UPI003397FEE5